MKIENPTESLLYTTVSTGLSSAIYQTLNVISHVVFKWTAKTFSRFPLTHSVQLKMGES